MSEKERIIEYLSAEIDYLDVDPTETIRLSMPHAQFVLKELKSDKLHSLRMAVLEYINEGIKEYGDHFLISERFGYFRKLALSAGIEFVNGTWILKEGE